MFASRGWGLTVKGRRETYMLLPVSIRVCVYIATFMFCHVQAFSIQNIESICMRNRE